PLAPLSARRRCEKPVLRRCDRTRNQKGELHELTAIERNVLQRSLIDDLSEPDRPLDWRNVRSDFDRLGKIADLELKVVDNRLSPLHDETREHFRAEPCRLNFDAIRTGGQEAELIFPGGDRCGAALRACLLRPYGDGRAANDGI